MTENLEVAPGAEIAQCFQTAMHTECGLTVGFSWLLYQGIASQPKMALP